MQMSFMPLMVGLFVLAQPGAALADVLPLKAGDLALGERYSTRVHTGGVQAEGKDIGARRHVSGNSWSSLVVGAKDGSANANWLVYGRPFYAMRAGTVVGCWRNAPDNTPGSLHADYEAGRFAGGGNHLWIRHADGSHALYAHAQPGSIPAELCPHNAKLFKGKSGTGKSPDIESEVMVTNGAQVAAGQFLGRVGNSGASKGGPHLHVHIEQAGKPVVMNFDRGLTTPFPDGKADIDGPWTRLAGKPLPNADILIWPPRAIGNYTFNGINGADYQRLFLHMTDSGMMPNTVTCTANGATYSSTWVPAKGQFVSRHGMTAAEAESWHKQYTGQGYKRTSSYTCGSRSVAVWRK